MNFDPQKHHRHSIRLPDHEYMDGGYFVTICTYQRESMFGEVVEDDVQLNEWGEAVYECWNALPAHFLQVELDAFVVMPNHLHGIIFIHGNVGAQHAAPLQNVVAGSLGAIIRSLKSAVTRKINMLRETPGAPVWQRNYYEHVIRDEKSLNALREYILYNPARWAEDRENPLRKMGSRG